MTTIVRKDGSSNILHANGPHFSPGLSALNFRKISSNGFGDARNCYPHSMAWFHDHLYVGTTRSNLAMTKVAVDEVGRRSNMAVWPVKGPANVYDNDLRAQIWRYNPRTDTWSQVFVAPLIRGNKGIDVPLSVGFRVMVIFQGKSDPAPALYVPTWATSHSPATVMLRSLDGTTFEIASPPGLGLGDPVPRALRALIAFKGRLFAGPAVGQKRGEGMSAGSLKVVVSSDPAIGDWQLACEPNFGDPNNVAAISMGVFNDHLYVGTTNIQEGFQVWRTRAEGTPPYRWTKVLTRGAYRGKLNQIAMTLYAFKNHLYIGSAIQSGGCDLDNNVGPAAPELIRVAPDDSWDIVMGEPRVTPDGIKTPLSGLGPGFNNQFSGYIWEMCAHDGWLYVGDAVWSAFMLFARHERLPEKIRRAVSPKQLDEFIRAHGGFDLWRSRDGIHWSRVTGDGFGNPYNLGIRRMLSTPYGLFVGAANSFGPEVAMRREAGWTYELNPRGGLEIWLGKTPSPESSSGTDGPRSETRNISTVRDEKTRIRDLIAEYYGGSGFHQAGYWRKDIKDVTAACQNLMDEILAFIPEKKGLILDIGCGLGATTRYLLKYYPAKSVMGICSTREELIVCEKSDPNISFRLSNLSRLPFPDAFFSAVLCAEGPARLCPNGEIFPEVHRILKPGGFLVGCDILSAGDEATNRRFYKKKALSEMRIEEYRDLLVQAGFVDVRIVDTTEECWNSFRKHYMRYFMQKTIGGEITLDIFAKLNSHFLKTANEASRYLLISAKKE